MHAIDFEMNTPSSANGQTGRFGHSSQAKSVNFQGSLWKSFELRLQSLDYPLPYLYESTRYSSIVPGK